MAAKKAPKPNKEYKIIKKRSGRHAVMLRGGKLAKAEQKVEILQKEGIIKKLTPKKKEAEAAPAAE
ncbi:MAG: hypothetical protein AB7T49_20950 [Oligoflexales bacterium]